MEGLKKVKIEVTLTEKQYNFLRWLAKYDNQQDNTRYWTPNRELAQLAELQVRETMEVYANDDFEIYEEEE